MKIEQTYKIGLREVGMRNELTNYGILAFLEDIATYHSGLVGYGVEDVEKNNGAFLILDWNLEVYKRLKFNDIIKVRTYALPVVKPTFHCYRNFEIYDENENLIATAQSKWLFYNFKERRIEKLTSERVADYQPEGNLQETENKINKIKEPISFEIVKESHARRMDIDVNNHMNNLVYLKLAYEVLPEDIYFSDELKKLRVTYKHQIKLGTKIKICYSKVDNKHIVVIKSQDDTRIHAIVELW